MERCAVTSFFLVGGLGVARLLNSSLALGMHLDPFRPAVSIFGSVVLFLALLIMSSRFYRRRGSGYVFVNLLTLTTLLGFMALGSLGGLQGMANTATVFLALWLVEKYADIHFKCEWNGWVFVLVLSLLAWRAALWLHLRPQFIAAA